MNKQRRKTLRRNTYVGAFLLLSLALLTAVTVRSSPLLFGKRDYWRVSFGVDSVVEEGYEVRTAGLKVGVVAAVERVPDHEIAPGRYVIAVLALEEGLTLWEGAEVVIASTGLLGRPSVILHRGNPTKKKLSPSQPLRGRVGRGLLDDLAGIARDNRSAIKSITENFAAMVKHTREGKGTVGKLIMDDELHRDLKRIVTALAEFTDAIRSPDSSLGKLMRDKELYDEITGAAREFKLTAKEIREGEGSIGYLLRNDRFAKDLEATMGRLRALIDGIDKGEGTLGLLLKDEQIRKDIAGSIASLRRFAERVENGEGTLAKLLDDGEVYENLRTASATVVSILEDVENGKGSLGMLLKDDSAYKELKRMLESFRETGEVARENAPLGSLVTFTSLFFSILN